MERCSAKATVQRRREGLPPLYVEAVLAQRFVLASKLVAFLPISGETETADRVECIAREIGETLERSLRKRPVCAGLVRTQPLTGAVVGHHSSAGGKAAVSPAGAFGDTPRLVHPHAQPGFRER